MDIEELRRRIDSGELTLTQSCNCIGAGKLLSNAGKSVGYQINCGWDILSAHSCDKKWKSFNLKLLEWIKKQNYPEKELGSVLSKIQLHDMHWDWFKKSNVYRGDEYVWFYMFADEEPQGACLIYHPKESIINSGNIFYIEYVAVAPWNRANPMSERIFKGIGTLIIKNVLNYAVNTLHLQHGFSLHSVPPVVDYYKKIGMQHYPERDKKELSSVLPYFEMPPSGAVKMLGVA